MNLTDKVAALKEGDEFIFGEIYNEFHQRVYFFVLAKTRSHYLAEEATQLTFIKLWNYRHKLDITLSLSLQLFQIAKTTLIDLLRKEGNRAKLSIVKNQDQSAVNTITERFETKELQTQIKQEVQKMPPVRKKVFELSRYESKSYKEIAKILSLSEKTVENHISLALKQLRRFITLFLFYFLR
jgi:RNA polymerase sigma-70 factor (family 1)